MAFAYTEKVAIPQPPVMEEIILLQLTKDEAETLLLVSRKIGGHPSGRRGYMDNILQALDRAGVKRIGVDHRGHMVHPFANIGSITLPNES